MKKAAMALFLVFIVLSKTTAQTNIAAGKVYGTWKKTGSPYKINGHINIPKDSLLKIEAGVKVEFQGAYMLHVYGSLQAIGAIGDSVVFTPYNKTTGWQGMHVHGSLQGKDSFIIQHARIEYANFSNLTLTSHGAIYMDSVNKVRISNCLFNNNKSNTGACMRINRSKLNINNVRFINNEAVDYGSTAIAASGSALLFYLSTVKANKLEFYFNKCHLPNNKKTDSLNGYSSGCIYSGITDLELSNSVFSENSASGPSCLSILGGLTSKIVIKNTVFKKNYSSSSSCLKQDNVNGITSYEGLIFQNNHIGNDEAIPGGTSVSFNSASHKGIFSINNSTFESSHGGSVAVFCRQTSFNNCKFINNDSTALTLFRSTNVSMNNSIVTNNLLGLRVEENCNLLINNSIIAYNGSKNINSNSISAGIFMVSGSTPAKYSIFNSIVQKNYNGKLFMNITGDIGGNIIPFLSNSIIEGGKDSAKFISGTGKITVTNYTNVINDTVAFVKPPKGIGPGFWDSTVDFHPLQTCSKTFAGLNAGLNTVDDGNTTIALTNTKDLAGNPRILCNTVDIGPYELEGAKNSVSINTEPIDQQICPRTTASISPTACGAALSYQWQRSLTGNLNSFTNISNANQINYTHQGKDSQFYRLIISQNECNKKDTSRAVKIGFLNGSTISIIQQPKDTGICANNAYTVSSSIAGKNNSYQWQSSKDGSLFSNLNAATNQSYASTVKDTSWYRLIISNSLCTNNKDTTRAAKINKLPLPKPTLGPDQTIANGGSATLTPGTFNSYNWYKGATTANYTVDKSNLDTGKNTVWVEVSNSYGCKAKDTVIINLRPVNGVKNALHAGIKLYPNPANQVLNVSFPDANKYAVFKLIKPSGELISYALINGNAQIDCRALSAGIYFISITYDGQEFTERIIKN